ncbi:hypothetical protein [Methanosarcina sp.]|uniref:hypothetical protein n=1 Tax=Methanosarcina sp. TaxID=2213 RepID=UPI003C74798E
MTERKRRQGQKGVKTIKEICPKCGEYLKRTYTRELVDGKQRFVKSGWSCPSSACEYVVKDYVELSEGEPVDNVKNFAEACCDQNSLKELKAALAGDADETDMKTWHLTEDQWRKALEVAIIAMENNLSVDEAIKCICDEEDQEA